MIVTGGPRILHFSTSEHILRTNCVRKQGTTCIDVGRCVDEDVGV